MVKLNRRQEEMETLRALDDKRVNEELYSTYRSIIKDIQAKVADHLEDVGDQPYWKQQQTKALAHLHDEMVDIIREKYPEVKETISKYKEDQLVKGYNGSFYDMEGQTGEELDFPMVNKEFLEASVKAPVAGKRLSERLYRNKERMAKQAQTAVTAGIIQGHSYQKIARQIAGVGEADYRKALRIARTEAGRMHSIGKAKAMSEAKEMGIDVMKQWVSSLDRRTRHTHQFLDGQIVAVDDNFKNSSGMEAKMPCMFGQPSEDCNCRCTAVTIVDGIKPTARRDNETGEIIENMTYQEWERKIDARHIETGSNLDYIKHNKTRDIQKGEIEDIPAIHGTVKARRVVNSHRDIYLSDSLGSARKSFSYFERKIAKAEKYLNLPDGAEPPRYLFVHGKKDTVLNSKSLGAYDPKTNTVIIETSKPNAKSIIKRLKQADEDTGVKGWFAVNDRGSSPVFHELGHYKHEQHIRHHARENGLTFSQSKDRFNQKLLEFLAENDYNVGEEISGYANQHLSSQIKSGDSRMTNEIIAEAFTKAKLDRNKRAQLIIDFMERGEW